MISAFYDSLTLLYMRWVIVRSTATKILLCLGGIALIVGLVSLSSTGSLVKLAASTDREDLSALKVYAQSYLLSYQSGELSGLISSTLAFVMVSVILTPFTGTSITSLIPHHQLVSVTKSSKHRFSDSVIAQFFSSISVLQLFMLTIVASLLSIDEGRVASVSYAWISWSSLVMLSCLFTWVAEFIARTLSMKHIFFLVAATLGTLGIALLLDPHHGRTLFGIGEFYVMLVQNFSTLSWWQKAGAILMVASIDAILLFVTYLLSMHTLSKPERVRQKKSTKALRYYPYSSNRMLSSWRLLGTQLWRSSEIRKPLLMAVAFSLVPIIFLSSRYSVLNGIVLIVPIISALSWGSNMFGLIGSGWVWLSTNPYIRSKIIWVGFTTQVLVSCALFLLMSVPPLLLHKVSGDDVLVGFSGLLVASLLMSRSAMSKSVHRPYPYRSGKRGETSLPPLTILEYTVRFIGWSGGIGLLTVAIGTSFGIYIQVLFMALVAAWSVTRIHFLQSKFVKKISLQSRIIRAIGTDNN